VIELHQAEWCPHSRKVRQRLTELGVDYIARQVEAELGDRSRLMERTGEDETPSCSSTTRSSRARRRSSYLDASFDAQPDADAHREKALDKGGLPD